MTSDAYFTLAATALAVAFLVRGKAPELVLMVELAALVLFGVIDEKAALMGFANDGVWTVGLLFLVSAAIKETGAMDLIARSVLGRPRSLAVAQLRMMLPVATLSTFLNNTPIVAMMVPAVNDFSRRTGMSASKLMMPLSFATILGGTCSLIGTSTNLVASSLAEKQGLTVGLFDIAIVGVPSALLGLAYIVIFTPRLLPDRKSPAADLSDARTYTVRMRVAASAPFVGSSIERAGLRHLPGLYLVGIERGETLLSAVAPETPLAASDVLIFVGAVDGVRDLRRIRGLSPENEEHHQLDTAKHTRRLFEVVVAPQSGLVGRSVRDAQFRTRFLAAILAIHRNGERLGGKVGDQILHTGDTLLLEASGDFQKQHGEDRAFALVSAVDDSAPLRHERAPLAILLLVGMIASNAFGLISLLKAATITTLGLLALRCLSLEQARRAFDFRVVVSIAASFGIGQALADSGLSAHVAQTMLEGARVLGPMGVVSAVYAATVLLNAFVSNNAAVALMFPIAMATTNALGLPARGTVMMLMMAGSADFSTPIGYQTNLMVYGPGGYRFADFLRFGLPLQLIVAATTLTICWYSWFSP